MNKKQFIFIWHINKIIMLISVKFYSVLLMYIRSLSDLPQFISEVYLEFKNKGESSVISTRVTHLGDDLHNSNDCS